MLFSLLMGFALAAEPQVTIHLLDHTGKSDTPDKLQRPTKEDSRPQFWLDWCDTWRSIDSSKTVKGDDAIKLIALLRKSLASSEAINLCGHHPIYGIDAVTPEGKVLTTSLCFTCGTWVQPSRRLEINGPYGIDHPLCKALRSVIELPAELLAVEEARMKKLR